MANSKPELMPDSLFIPARTIWIPMPDRAIDFADEAQSNVLPTLAAVQDSIETHR